MGAYNNVFKRVEKKYRLVRSQRAAVEAAADAVMAPDAYGRTRITSLYLDTPERAMIARSVEKPLYKEKLRLRAYGEEAGALLMAAFAAGPLRREAGCPPLSDDEVQARVLAAALTCGASSDALSLPVFFGIKKKFKGIVYKRRLVLSLPAALAFVSGLPYEQACTRWPVANADQAATALAPQTRQIARELVAAMDRHLPLVPSMGIACDRVAWALREGWAPTDARDATDPGFRITFDNRLEYLDCFDASWRPGAEAWCPIIAPGESIMEVKSASAYPPWLTATLSANAIFPASFTKYGNAYQMAS
ncbi:MAG: polyphosphate polymerase domain-containing protein [Adlercreutzia sp.]|uniref:polyphosphate polymerase domain-containing protein n=1 Tax=uncultured Adlercreutzia sp. TaxID=875803 RepID=UPI00216E5B41|nr:polyphosphate polymerase domain-containing protein [uncultured Adlercreutzia sp.]MCI8425114.1 polyphosphate polymerase domain-containing protein [Adlercreutzia sp.]